MAWQFVATAIICYLFGSLSTSITIARLVKGIDIREYGSGNAGATNTLRTLGRKWAVIVLLLDVLKGVLPVVVAHALSDDARIHVVAALGTIAGHDFPVYFGFRGGRGVGTSLGATAAMMPPLALVMPLIGALIFIPFRYVSLMSILGTVVTGVIILILAGADRVPNAYGVYAVIAAGLIVVLHRHNIARLLAGTEPKFGQGGGRRSGPGMMGGRP